MYCICILIIMSIIVYSNKNNSLTLFVIFIYKIIYTYKAYDVVILLYNSHHIIYMNKSAVRCNTGTILKCVPLFPSIFATTKQLPAAE